MSLSTQEALIYTPCAGIFSTTYRVGPQHDARADPQMAADARRSRSSPAQHRCMHDIAGLRAWSRAWRVSTTRGELNSPLSGRRGVRSVPRRRRRSFVRAAPCSVEQRHSSASFHFLHRSVFCIAPSSASLHLLHPFFASHHFLHRFVFPSFCCAGEDGELRRIK